MYCPAWSIKTFVLAILVAETVQSAMVTIPAVVHSIALAAVKPNQPDPSVAILTVWTVPLYPYNAVELIFIPVDADAEVWIIPVPAAVNNPAVIAQPLTAPPIYPEVAVTIPA